MNGTNKSVLLYSGGMDSFLMNYIVKPDTTLFIRTHTEANDLEYETLLKLQEKGIITNNVEVVEYDLSKYERPEQNYYLPLRNLHFVTLASHYGDKVFLGSTGCSVHFDNNEKFSTMCENLISYLLSETNEGPVKVLLPFRDTSKTDLLKLYVNLGGDIEIAYNSSLSCYTPKDNKPCMSCVCCASKFTAFYNNGYNFSEDEINKFITYVGDNKEIQKGDVIELYNKLKERS